MNSRPFKLLKLLCTRRQYDVMFYASHYVDELWVRSTITLCRKEGMSVIFVSGKPLPDDIKDVYRRNNIPFMDNCTGRELKYLQPKIVVTASTGLNKSIFNESTAFLIHMPHSISSLHMIYPADTFDGYDYLFSAGPHHDAEMKTISSIRHLSNFKGSIPVGYGKLDILFDASKSITNNQKPMVMIAPSWGAKNILDSMGIEFVGKLLEQGLRVTIRPHPMFFIEQSPFIDEAEKTFGTNPAFALESSMGLGKALFEADLLVTDYSGIAQEYSALRGNPVVFVDVAKKVLNPDWEQYGLTPIEISSRSILGPLVGASVDEAFDKVMETLRDTAAWKERATSFKRHYLHHEECAPYALNALKLLVADADIRRQAA